MPVATASTLGSKTISSVGAFGHLDLAGVGVGLSPFVEEHHHGRCAVAADGGGTFQKGAFALFERDRVDDALALHDLQSGFEHLPFRRVDHHRHTGDFGLRGHEVQKVAHGLRPVDQAVVHADVDELCSGVDLCAGHGERFVVVAFADETGELRRAGHVGALADVDEVGLGDDAQRFETAQDRDMVRCGETPRRVVARDLRKFEDMFGGGAATAADDVDQPAPHVLGAVGGEHRRRLVVAAHDVRKAGVGVRRDARLGHGGQPFQIGEQLLGAVGAVESDRKRPCMGYRSVEGLDGLSRKGASRCVGERAGDHHRRADAACAALVVDGGQRGLGVERVEDRFDKQQVGAPVQQSPHLLAVGGAHLGERDVARGGIVDVRRHRERAVGGADRAGDEARFERVACGEGVGCCAGHAGCCAGDFVGAALQTVVGQRDGVGIERIGFDDVGACGEVFFVDFAHHVGAGQRQQVVAAAQLPFPVAEPFAAVGRFVQPVALHHRAEAAVEQQDAFVEYLFDRFSHFLTISISNNRLQFFPVTKMRRVAAS